MPATDLIFNLIGRDMASGPMRRVGATAEATAGQVRKSESALSSMLMAGKRIAPQLALLGGGFAAVTAAIDIGKDAAKFQRNMLLIQTQAGATAGQVKSMSKAVLASAGELGTSPEQLATSLYHAYSVTKNQTEALKIMTIAAKGAKIGNADLEETTNALTSTVASGIKGAQNYAQAMGMLNTIVGAGDMKLSDLNEALGSGILIMAKTFGVSLTQVGAALATFGDLNIRGADAATQLRMAVMALATPVKGGQAAMEKLLGGLTAEKLTSDLAKGGLTRALGDLKSHLAAVGASGQRSLAGLAVSLKQTGTTGDQVGTIITKVFGRKAGVGLSVLIDQLDRYRLKLSDIAKGANSFGSSWQATTHTTAFVFSRLRAEFTAGGITIANQLLPPVTRFAAMIGVELPKAAATAKAILTPFAHDIGGALAGAWHVLGAAMSIVADVLGPIVHALDAVKGPIGAVAAAVIGAVVAFKLFAAVPAILETVALKMLYARDSVVGFGVASKAMATQFVANSAVVVGAAEATSLGVVESGAAARVGWSGILGPLGAVVVGVGLLVSMFHRSSGASKEAAAAAKAYTEALSGGSGGSKATIVDTIREQLSKNDVPALVGKLNKALGSTAYSGNQFVTAIASGNPALVKLGNNLESVIAKNYQLYTAEVKSGRSGSAQAKQYKERADAAQRLIGVLGVQYQALTKAQQKDLLDTKAFAGVSSSIDQVAQSAQIGSDTARRYAEMMGIVVDKNGIAAASHATVAAAVKTVGDAYAKATQTGDDFLKALSTFAGSEGTAADRATLISATLKAANGDALTFAGSMNAAFVANKQFFDDVNTNSGATNILSKALGDSKRTSASIATAHQQAARAVKTYLRAVIDLKTGTINYNNAAAGPLISDLSSIQSAAMNAAGATYQHARATMSGKDAADAAYKVYTTMTRRSLIDQATQLGISRKAARRLADTYFGMPKQVKTAIEAEGANPILDVLNKIGRLLAKFTGQPWDVKVDAKTPADPKLSALDRKIHGIVDRTYVATIDLQVNDSLAQTTIANDKKQIANAIANPPKISAPHPAAPSPSSILTSPADTATGAAAAAAKGPSRAQTAATKRRDRIAALLGSAPSKPTAYDQLATAKQNYTDERSKVHDAITGTFDITTAGQQPYGEPVTFGTIRAQLQKAVANAHRFVSALRKLSKEGLNRGLLEQLAEAGPSALPEALALASATPKQLSALNRDYKALGRYGGSAGKYMADQMYGAGVNAAQGLVNGLKSKESALNHAIRSLGNGMVSTLKDALSIHSPSRKTHWIGQMVGAGLEDGIRSTLPHVHSASKDLANASLPKPHGAAAAGGVYIEKQELHVHYPLEGDLNEALKQLTRMSASQMRAASQGLGR